MRKLTRATDADEGKPADPYRRLPEQIRVEDMATTQAVGPVPDPTMGRDAERDFMLRNAGG